MRVKKCKEHPTYKAVHRPRGGCLACFRMWAYKNPKKLIEFFIQVGVERGHLS